MAWSEPTPGLPIPAEDELLRKAGRDHLIVNKIRRETAEHEVFFLLPDHLVTRRKRNEMGKTLGGDDDAVLHEAGDRFFHRKKLGHSIPAAKSKNRFPSGSVTANPEASCTTNG